MAHPSPIRLYLLGSFRLEREGRTTHLRTRKVESLLAYLALFPEAHTREKLAALLWGDSTDEQARHSLRTALAALRKELGDEILLTDRETVQLNPAPPLWVDALEFQAQANKFLTPSSSNPAAVNFELYQNDLLKEFYDDWIAPERERLRLLYLDALLQLAQYYRSTSDYARAIEIAQKVLAADRANEKAYQHLMFCYAATGDRIAALKQYDECKQILHDELAVEPSSETTALRDHIMQELTGAKSQAAAFTNLPIPLTSFVGRKQELAELKESLSNTRLLTLTGAGGCGKTRLAIQVGREFADTHRFKHGVWWVDLAVLSDPTLVPQTVAAVFDLREASNVPIINLLSNYLREKELLLVLDNCEHLIDACARLAETLLSACAKLQIFTTSREALSITGEVVWRVPSLAVPDAEHLPPLDQLTQYDAIQLFVQRAAAIVPNWKLNGNASAVVRICARLDGIPLAIELAAARLKALSAEQIAARLDDRFQLLTGGSRTALPRQQTLRAAIDWSYELLSDAERALLQRLSVFAGGWTLGAAEAVCSGNGSERNQVLDFLTKLVDKSLVVVEERDGSLRYRMLETIRAYAREQLSDFGELASVQDRHLKYFSSFAEEAERGLISAAQLMWLDRCDVEQDNLRAALEWSLGGGDKSLGLTLARGAFWFWATRSYLSEGVHWLEAVLEQTWGVENNAARGQVLVCLGVLTEDLGNIERAGIAFDEALRLLQKEKDIRWYVLARVQIGWWLIFQRDLEGARAIFEEAVVLSRQLQDPWNIANSLGALAALLARIDLDSALPAAEESIATWRKVGDGFGLIRALIYRASIAQRQQDHPRAMALYEECIALCQERRQKDYHAVALIQMSIAIKNQGDYERPETLLKQSMNLAKEVGSHLAVANVLVGFANIAEGRGNYQRTARLLGAVEAIYNEEKMPGPTGLIIGAVYQQLIESTRDGLDEASFTAAWAEGRAMNLEHAIEYALEHVKSIS